MEVEKRKRSDDGEVDGKRVKAREDDGEKAATATATVDDEVEEFFAILRRVRVAVKYFKKGNNQNARELTEGRRWRSPPSSFEPKGLEGVNGVKGKESVEDNVVVGLDLNVDPCADQV